jgi:2-oxoglutarate ferredoxin oxidoreductase subunit gamma
MCRGTMTKEKEDASRQEVLITGFGGQGIVLAGRILGKAVVLGDNKESTLVQAYGPEARGGACSAQVIISEDPIHYPYVRYPHILVCMSQGGFDKFIHQLREGGPLLIDQDLVKPRGFDGQVYAIPATRMAEELGRKMMANIIMLGFMTAITGAVSVESALNAVLDSVPKGTEETNAAAFNKGCDYGSAVLKGQEKKATGKTGA